MKKLAIKKVALSLFLAGYAASSAYALEPVKTVRSIEGSAPVIWSKGSTPKQKALTLRITNDPAGTTALGSGEHAKVGNYIHIFYDLKDADGDLDTDADHAVSKTLRVWIKKSSTGAWEEVTADISKQTANSGELGHVYFKIIEKMAGAQKIGFQLQEITPFGVPNKGQWLTVADIWSSNDPSKGDTEKEDPGTGDEGPGDPDPDNPVGPVEDPDATMLGIFKYNSTGNLDLSVNLATTALTTDAVTPHYGDKLAAIVWLKANSNASSDVPDFQTDLNQSEAYTFTWSLDGTYEGTQAIATETITFGASTDATDKYGIIVLGNPNGSHNSVYNNLNSGSGYKAGIQGYKLKVTAN